jgi:hypothetical protein
MYAKVEIYFHWIYYGSAAGLYPRTAGVNDLGNPVRDAVADGGGVILPGVTADGSPNTKRVTITSNNSFMNLNQSLFMMLVM